MADTFEVRDQRNPGWYWGDNLLVLRDGKQLGVYGIAVYVYLATRARNDKTPAIATGDIADTIDASQSKVVASLRLLEKLKWIGVERHKGSASVYYLLPRPDPIPEPISQNDQPPAEPLTPPVDDPALCVTRWFRNGSGTAVASVHRTPALQPPWMVKIYEHQEPGKGSKVYEGIGHTRRIAWESARQAARDRRHTANLYGMEDVLGVDKSTPEPVAGEPSSLPVTAEPYEDPTRLSMEQIKELRLTRAQWGVLKAAEQAGKKRRSVIKHCDSKINAHPLEPRFAEMMEAVNACVVQDMNDPGMAAEFARVIRTKLWESREKGQYYGPDELLLFAKERPKVESVWFLPAKLSTWRQQRKGITNGENGAGTGVTVSGGTGDEQSKLEDVFKRLGRDPNTAKNYLPQV